MVAESFKRSHKVLALCVALAFASAALALGFAVTANAEESGSTSQPTISSDKEDYPPGGTVILTGSGWQPGESVNIFVNDDQGKTWSRDVDVTADENGDIRDEFQLPDWFVAQYSVKATGAQSGVATTSFTDAPVKVEGKDNVANAPYDGGPLEGWRELDKVPMRLVYTNSGSQTVTVEFDHRSTSGRRIPGIRDLVDWSGDSRISSLNAQLTDTTGPIWTYTVTANATSGTNNSNPGYVFFNAHLAAGSHAYPGASMQIKLGGAGNGTIGIKPSDVLAARPDLVVDKTGPATAAPGSTIEYKIFYKNISTTDAATGAALTDVLPSDANGNPLVTFDSCSDNCTVTGNEVSWVVGDLAPGAGTDPNNQLSRTLKVKIPQNAANGTSYVNNSDILSADNEQDLALCTGVDSDNNADNDTPDCDNYDSLKTTVASNSSPTAVDDSYNVNEDQTLTVSDGPNDVLANDTDPDNDTLSVTGNTQPQHGSVTVNANGSFTYTPNANYNGPDSFNYTVSDGKGGTATGTVNITVNPVNDTPTITPNIGDKTILEDADTGDISFTVGDAESAAGDLVVTASSSDTTLVPNDNANLILGGTGANRTIKVKPAADRFGGPATITLTVSDGMAPGSQSATETFDVNVTPVNDAPSFDVPANAPPVNEDAPAQTVANFATNIFVGPFESSQTTTQFQVTNNSDPSLFSAGPAIDPSSGDLTYTPAANAFGTANVTVRAKDDGGTANGGVDTSTEKTFSITLNPVNDDPNAVDDSANAEEDGPEIAIDVLANDDDGPDSGETLTVTSVTQPPSGEGSTEIIESGPDEGKVRFTPSADFFGQTTFNYTISDGNGGTVTATVTVDVSATNDPPEIGFTDPTGDTQTVDESVSQTRTYSYNLDDTDGPPSQVTESCGGATKVDTPEANSFQCVFPDGPNTFTVSVTADDGQASNTTASDSIEVTVNNVPPTADDDTASADENGPAVEIDVLSNDTDPANDQNETNDPLTITDVSGPPSGEGSVEIIEGGKKVRFTPNPNFEGSSTSFDYTISDGDGGTDTATVTVNITNENDPPVLDLNGEDAGRDFDATFAEDDPAASIVGTTGNGALSVTDADDENMESATATLTNKPDGNAETLSVDASAVPSISATGYDSSSGVLSLSGTATKAQYEQVLRTVKYDNASQNPSTQDRIVEFVINDGDADSLKPNSTVAVISVNDDPVATNDPYATDEDQTLTVGAANGVLANDTDPDGDTLTVTDNTQPQHGSVSVNANGSFTYTPDANFNGSDSFDYTVSDGNGGTATARVNITVNSVDDAPVIEKIEYGNAAPNGSVDGGPVDEGSPATIIVTAGDPDTPNNALRYSFDCDNDGTFETDLQQSNTTTCTYPDDGTYPVNVKVTDDTQQSDTASKDVEVVNVAPKVVLSGPDKAKEGDTEEYSFTVTDPGAEDTFTVENGYPTCGQHGQLVGGSLQINASGGSFRCRFPDGDLSTNVEIQVRDDDGALDADSQRVVIVEVANVAPVLTIAADQAADEGTGKDFDLGSFTDPGDDGDWKVTVEWGDGSANTTFDSASPGNLPQKPHTYADDGTYTVTVTVAEADNGPSDSKTFTVNVANVAPTANDDQMNTTELQEVTANLLDNDTDPGSDLDGASLKILGASGPSDGVATIGNLLDGKVTYTPNGGFIGADSFRYEICDDDGECDTADVQVTVGPVDCNAQGVIRGTAQADLLRGTAGNDIICAFAGKDTIYGGGGDDLIVGAEGDDRMWGQGGEDVMRGGANTDAMDGGLGDDYMTGDAGRDVMLGRGGTDFLDLRDGSAGDAGNGGAGTDTCAKDAGDRTVSCERQ